MKIILIIAAIIFFIIIILNIIEKSHRRKKSKKAYQLYLDSLNQINQICTKFEIPHQKEGDSPSRVSYALEDKHPKIWSRIDAGELTNFRNKQELNEAYHQLKKLLDKSTDLYVKWENIANPIY